MSFEREGFSVIAVAALVAAGMYAAALNRRSWALWLLAFVLTIVALGVAYFFREPVRARESAAAPNMGSEMLVLLRTSRGEVPARETAGSALHPVVTYGKEGEQVQWRPRKALLRLGSPVGIDLPLNAAPPSTVREMPRAESTVFAELSQR